VNDVFLRKVWKETDFGFELFFEQKDTKVAKGLIME